MSTSPFFGIRAFDAAHITPTGMVDPVLLTDYVSNNLLHCADQTCARVLVNDMSPVSSLTGNSVPQYTSGGYDSTQWRPIAAYGPFPLSCAISAGTVTTYRIRCAIYAAAATSTCSFAVHAMTGYGYGYIDFMSSSSLTTGVDCVVFSAAVSVTPAWLSADPTSSNSIMTISPASIYERVWEVADVPGSSTPVGLVVPTIVFRVMAKGAGEPRLHGVHIAEVQ
jgi:hypothetical protein